MKLPSRAWQDTYSWGNSDTFCISEAAWRFFFDFALRGWLVNSGSLFCLIGSNYVFSLSVTNSLYWFCPTLSNVVTVSTTGGNIMSWVSRTSSSLVDYRKGFPIFVIIVDSVLLYNFLNAFCTPVLCSWWRQSGFLPLSPFVTSNEHSNSFTSIVTPGPDTIYLSSCDEFSVCPIAPPSLLTSLLIF